MHNTVASCVTGNCPLDASRGGAHGSLSRDGLISHLTRRIAMYILTDEVKYATRYVASLLASTGLWPHTSHINYPDPVAGEIPTSRYLCYRGSVVGNELTWQTQV